MCNIGPGFGDVGATRTYAGIPIGGQIVLTTLMLLGRLELYTALVVLLPSFWRKEKMNVRCDARRGGLSKQGTATYFVS